MPPSEDALPDPMSSSQNQVQQDIGNNPGQVLGQQSGGQAINISGGTVVFQDSQGRPVRPEELNKLPKVPPLLPYLPDRTEQEYELGKAIQNLMVRPRQQPLLCIVHGDEQQSHDQFLDRLQKVSLPRLLQLNLKTTSIRDYHLKWPAS
ncbi:MAG: hypothetical protein AAGA75_12230 [Cyanobacteria bacterium P01_E01_bin.6]